jgi:hypothetical protein
MKRALTYVLYVVVAVSLVLGYASCIRAGAGGGNGNTSQDGEDAGELAGALVIQAFSDLPEPSPDNTGKLYFVIEEDTFYYSNGTDYVRIDLTGRAGRPGRTCGSRGTRRAGRSRRTSRTAGPYR